VERFYNPPGSKPFRIDLWGFADYMAWKGRQIIPIQACVAGRYKDHYKKLTEACPLAMKYVVDTKQKIHLISWDLDAYPPACSLIVIGLADFIGRG